MYESIKLIKINEVYFHVETEKSVSMELSEYFTFQVPGYQFHPKFKCKKWDGKLRIFNRLHNTIYTGLIEEIKNFCEKRNYILEYQKPKIQEYSKENIENFLKKICNTIQIRDYQYESFLHGIKNKKSLIISPTGSGKGYIIYLLSRWFNLFYKNKKILIVVPTLSLIEQMYKDFIYYSSEDNSFDSEMFIQKIYSGQSKEISKSITISTWQSLYTLPKEYFHQFDFVLIDEVHLAAAKSLKNILENCINASYRFGTTGTIQETKCHSMIIEGLTGPKFQATTTKKLMEEKTLATLNIKCIVFKYPDNECKDIKRLKYQEEISYIVSHKKRNKYICKFATKLNGNTLILFRYIEEHGKILYNTISKLVDDKRKVFFVYGLTKMEMREKVREITESEKNAIIIASIGVFSTGVNIKNLENIIFSSPSKSRIKTLQSIGRVLRIGRSNKATLYDIVDDLHWKKKKNFALKHFLERVKIYDSEKFNYSVYELKL